MAGKNKSPERKDDSHSKYKLDILLYPTKKTLWLFIKALLRYTQWLSELWLCQPSRNLHQVFISDCVSTMLTPC